MKNWSVEELLGSTPGTLSDPEPSQEQAPAEKDWTIEELLATAPAQLGVTGKRHEIEPSRGSKPRLQEPPVQSAPQKNWSIEELLSSTPSLFAAPRGGTGPGSKVTWKDPLWDDAEVQASRRTGVPVPVIRAIRMHGERSNANQVSPVGAKGVFQFMPKTRDLFLKKYGVDAFSQDPVEQATAAAYHLLESYKRTGNWLRAAAGYNGGISAERGRNKTAENRNYVSRIAAAPGMSDYL